MSQQTERKSDIDAVTFEVLRSAFEHTADRMSTVLQRTSFSPTIYDMVDFSNAIFTPEIDLVGQTANCPVHLAAITSAPKPRSTSSAWTNWAKTISFSSTTRITVVHTSMTSLGHSRYTTVRTNCSGSV